MKQMRDTVATLPAVFPVDCAGDNYGCADRPPGDRVGMRTSRFISRTAGNSNVRGCAATARIAAPTAAYAESSRARRSRGVFRWLDRAGCR